MTILANAGRRSSPARSGPSRLTDATAATLTCLACLCGLGATPAALAQQVAAAGSAQPSGALEEVVVTAERRGEQLQTTPIAITALTAEAMQARNLVNISDVGAYVTSTVLAPLGAGWGSPMAACSARCSICSTSNAGKCCAARWVPCSARTPRPARFA